MKAREAPGANATKEDALKPAALTGDALAELTSRVLRHFDEHRPEPASFPAMASKIIEVVEHPDVDVARLAHLVEREPAICASVLAVANSAALRPKSPVQNIRTAITFLGLKRVANIATGVACRSLFDVEVVVERQLFSGRWERLFHAAMTEAFAASFVAMERQRGASDGIFLTAMLHDIGKPLGLRSLSALLVSGELKTIPDDEGIEELLRRVRVAIGVTALTSFNMPEHLVELCRQQDAVELPSGPAWTDLHVVRLVSALNDLRMATINTQPPIAALLSAASAMHLSPEAIVAIARQVSEHAQQVGLLFSITDGADETGYLDFVTRCVRDLPG